MLSYSPEGARLQPYLNNPMRFFKNWKSMGDLLAWNLEDGYYSAFSHENNEGIVRIFPQEMNPGCNIWTYGYQPQIRTRKNFSGSESHNGYVEMWGGITHGFNKYFTLGSCQTISWSEWMYPYIKTGGLHYANNDFAVTFLQKNENDYEVNLCPAGEIKGIELKVESPASKKVYLHVSYKSFFPKIDMKGYTFAARDKDVELILSKKGKEIIRLRSQKRLQIF